MPRDELAKLFTDLLRDYPSSTIARRCGYRSRSTVHAIAKGLSLISVDRLIRLSRWLALQGDYRVVNLFAAHQMLPAVLIDGNFDDEASDFQRWSAAARDAHRHGDTRAMSEALRRLMKVYARAEGERDLLEKRRVA